MSVENYRAIMLLHALGDTIGFKNGQWEFNYFNKDLSYKTTLEIVFEFIALGGITNINLKGWNVSDDTLIHIAVAKTLLENYGTIIIVFISVIVITNLRYIMLHTNTRNG